MFRKTLAVATCGLIVGLVGCKSGSSTAAPSEPAMPTTAPAMPATTMPTSAPTSFMDKAKDLIKKGEAMLAKGKTDNSPDEQSEGQKLIDEGKSLMAKSHMFGQ